MTKTYKLCGTNRRGECIESYMESANKPNTNKWLAEVAEFERWRGVRFEHYICMSGDGGYRNIRAKRPEFSF